MTNVKREIVEIIRGRCNCEGDNLSCIICQKQAQKIIDLVLSKLNYKNEAASPDCPEYAIEVGFNQAIDEMKSKLREGLK